MIAAAPYFFHCLQLQNITDLNYKTTCHLTTRKEKQKEQKAMSNERSVTDKMTVTDIPVSYSVQKLHKIVGLPRSQLLCCPVVVSCIKYDLRGRLKRNYITAHNKALACLTSSHL